MLRFIFRAWFCWSAAAAMPAAVLADVSIEGRTPTETQLVGPDDSQQLLVHLPGRKNLEEDVTRKVSFVSKPEGVVRVDSHGFLVPLKNGSATVFAKMNDAAIAEHKVIVTQFESRRPVSFPNQVVPLLTQAGCNGGSCHGRPTGQNNFRLSLLGFEPDKDHEFLTREARGRRISPAAPGQSLILRKASGDLPHEGGVRIEKNGAAYQLIARWISEGLLHDAPDEPEVERIEVHPGERVVSRRGSQQLMVTAIMSDGTRRDVTRAAEFTPNQEDMAEVDHHGLVRFKDRTGATSVMVRFQKQVGVFMATIPLGIEEPTFPNPRNFIDELVFSKLRTLGMPVSSECSDEEFLRRATLDIAGRIPSLAETKAFRKSNAPDKRARLIDALLDDPGYANLFANKWSAILRNKTATNLEQISRETFAFHGWIRDNLRRNRPFDHWVSELITARGKAGVNPAVSWYRVVKDPKEQMADVAQVFLGVRMQCAQCHHHPYERWSQDDYYRFTAFFSTVGRKEVRKMPEADAIYHKRVVARMKNPVTNRELKPAFLDADPLELPAERDPRIDLADWITDSSNPYFARMLANRYWKHFFNRGLIEPEDDIRVTNPPTHPRLLKALAKHFSDSKFDLKALVRTICNSRVYQLSSTPNEHNTEDEQNFARYYPRRLSAEIMLDAINDLAGSRNNFSRQPTGVRAIALPDNSFNRQSQFLNVFGRPQMDTSCECERTTEANLAQSLHLINSDTIHSLLSASSGRAAQLAQEEKRPDEERIHELYLRAFGRLPEAEEYDIAIRHLAKKRNQSAADPRKLSKQKAEQQAFEDIIWVLMNTKEFLFNH